jgi:predicted ATP-grasp superfamily ATP-dependent carboligase
MTTIWAIGASVRSLAQCLRAAGHTVVAADLFNDFDLQRVASRTQRVVHFPGGFLQLADGVQADAFVYTGGLENYPDVIDALAARLPLLGNPGHVLRRVRSIDELRRLLDAAGFRMPPMEETWHGNGDKRWLRKSRFSSGGLRVHWASSNAFAAPGSQEYFQEFIAGEVYGASFEITPDGIRLLGMARQLTDCPWTNVPGFQYAGSIGPVQLADDLQHEVMRLGQVVAREFELRGWFGIDFILDRAGELWVLEVNPRYTASMELLTGKQEPLAGKAVLYAARRLCVTHAFSRRLMERSDIADIPCPGSEIAAGSPVLTLFATGLSETDVLASLQTKASKLRSEIADLQTEPTTIAIE